MPSVNLANELFWEKLYTD